MRVRWSWALVALGAIGIGMIGWGIGHRAAPAANDLVLTAGSQLGIVTTVAHNASHTVVTSVAVGAKVHVKATVTGAFGVATGTVQSRVYANGTCSGFIEGESNPVALSSGIADITAFTWSSTDSGAMSWIVHYNGDATYGARDGACVKVTITKINSSIALVVHDPAHHVVTEVPLGTKAHPKVTLSGSQGVPTGSLELYWWKNANCFDLAAFSAYPYALSNGAVDATAFARPSDLVGAHSMRAHYLGDSTYNDSWGPCVSYDVVKAIPAVFLNVHDASHEGAQIVVLGTGLHTAVSLSGPVGTPTGSVQIWGYDTDNCTGGAVTQTVTAAAAIDPAGGTATRSSPGYKSWFARYLGDAKYSAKSSACQKARWMPTMTLTGAVHDVNHHVVTTVAPGTEVHLKATATGSYGTVTGVVASYIYTGGTCKSGANKNLGSVTLSSGVADDGSVSFTPSSPGEYFFVPQYVQSQSSTYIGTTGPCVAFTVANPATPTPAPTPKPTPKPTPTPTVKPTPTPKATATPAPTKPPTPAPSASTTPATAAPSTPPTSTPGPTSAGGPTATAAPPPTSGPGGSPASTGDATGQSAAPSTAAPSASPNPNPAPTGDGGGVPTVILGLVLLLVIAAIVIGWRSRRSSAGR